MEIVKPQKIHLFAASPAAEKTDEFLYRLAGMVKFVVNQREGKTTIRELASGTAQRVSTIRLGLEWLAAGGHATVLGEDDAVLLSTGSGETNQYVQRELYVAVKGLLAETAAYRAYFARMDVERLINLK